MLSQSITAEELYSACIDLLSSVNQSIKNGHGAIRSNCSDGRPAATILADTAVTPTVSEMT